MRAVKLDSYNKKGFLSCPYPYNNIESVLYVEDEVAFFLCVPRQFAPQDWQQKTGG